MLPHLHSVCAEMDIPSQPSDVERRANPVHANEDCGVHDTVLRTPHQRKNRRDLHELHEDESARDVRLILNPHVEPLVAERLEHDVRGDNGEQNPLVPHHGNKRHGGGIRGEADGARDAEHRRNSRHRRRKPLLVVAYPRHRPNPVYGNAKRSKQREVGDDRTCKFNAPDPVRAENTRHVREHDRWNQQVQDEPYVAEHEICLYRADFHAVISSCFFSTIVK